MEKLNKYAEEEVKVLLEILRSKNLYIPEVYNTSLSGNIPNEEVSLKCNLPKYLDYVLRTISMNNRLPSGTLDTLYALMYAFVFFVPFNMIPLYVREEHFVKIGLVEWRLKIGK